MCMCMFLRAPGSLVFVLRLVVVSRGRIDQRKRFARADLSQNVVHTLGHLRSPAVEVIATPTESARQWRISWAQRYAWQLEPRAMPMAMKTE